jgi:hypothetical protein
MASESERTTPLRLQQRHRVTRTDLLVYPGDRVVPARHSISRRG